MFDAEHIAVANIASPGTAKNIEANPKVCLTFIHVFAQKGYKIKGHAINVLPHESEFEFWAKPLKNMILDRFPIHSVFVIRASGVENILAPSYTYYPETSVADQVTAAKKAYAKTLEKEPQCLWPDDRR